MRLGSFSIDAGVVLLLAVAVAALTRSVVLTGVVVAEAAVALVVWEARTGLTVGHAALHLRTARDDRPWSPGAVRALVRAGVVGVGALAGVVGAWVVVGSGGLDRTGRGRTWADRAGRTVVVRVADVAQSAAEPTAGASPHTGPVRQRLSRPGPAASAPAVPGPVSGPAPGPVIPGPVVPGPVVPGPVTSPVRHGPSGPAAPRSRQLMIGGPTATAPPVGPRPVGPRPVVPRPVRPGVQRPTVRPAAPGSNPVPPPVPTPPPVGALPAGPPPAAAPSPRPDVTVSLPRPDVTVLLVFDGGQRDQLPFGTAAVLGRDPAPQVASDRTIVVRDDVGSVSKSHLRIEHTADGVWLTDLGSTNGTHLLVDNRVSEVGPDGPMVPLAPRVRTRVDDVVRVALGQRLLMVSYMVRGGRP